MEKNRKVPLNDSSFVLLRSLIYITYECQDLFRFISLGNQRLVNDDLTEKSMESTRDLVKLNLPFSFVF